MREFAEYLLEFAGTGWGPVVLVLHSFFESFILPLANELFLIPVALARPHLSLVFAMMSAVASTCGIAVGYFIGKRGGRPLLVRLIKPKILVLAKREIHKYDTWAVAIACLTPVPVKVFALVAGAVHLNFKKMIVIAFISRSTRFLLVSSLIFFYGEVMKEWILDYMNWFFIAIIVFMLASAIVWKKLEQHLLEKRTLEKVPVN